VTSTKCSRFSLAPRSRAGEDHLLDRALNFGGVGFVAGVLKPSGDPFSGVGMLELVDRPVVRPIQPAQLVLDEFGGDVLGFQDMSGRKLLRWLHVVK
jgi:hypothetical protein